MTCPPRPYVDGLQLGSIAVVALVEKGNEGTSEFLSHCVRGSLFVVFGCGWKERGFGGGRARHDGIRFEQTGISYHTETGFHMVSGMPLMSKELNFFSIRSFFTSSWYVRPLFLRALFISYPSSLLRRPTAMAFSPLVSIYETLRRSTQTGSFDFYT